MGHTGTKSCLPKPSPGFAIVFLRRLQWLPVLAGQKANPLALKVSLPPTFFQPNGPLSFSPPFVQVLPSSPPFCKLSSVQLCPPTQNSCDAHAAKSAQKCQAAVLRGKDMAEAASRKPALPPSFDYGKETDMESDRVSGSSRRASWIFFSSCVSFFFFFFDT